VHPAETIRGKKLERVRSAPAVIFDGPNGEPRIDYYENVSFPMRHV
jgi:hypothetical protein